MHKTLAPRLIPALMAIAFAGGAHASGFQLLGEQSATNLGNAGAGSAAAAENASTIFYNPAGMTELGRGNVSAGLVAVKTSFQFTNGSSNAPGFNGGGDGGDGGGWGFVPNAYGSWQVAKDWFVGLGISAPFGLKTEYNDNWIGSAHSNSFDIKTINLNPSVAWRANEWLSLGAGINWQKIDATYERSAGVGLAANLTCPTVIPPAGPAAGRNVNAACQSDAKLEMDDDAWGWNIGALFKPAAQTKIGLSYRSAISYTATGNIAVTGPASAAPGVSSDISAKIKLPDTAILSVVQGIGDKWEVLGDISWTGWSSIPYVDINRTSGALNGQTAQKLNTQFDDAWRFALGANYKLNDAWKLRFGIAYDQTPVPNAEQRLVSLPDNDRTWFSAGFTWKPAKNMALDVGAAYLYLSNTPINNNEAGKGLVNGNYDSYAFILGSQFSMSF